jgi:O-antigen/teichoic acid export membrane protein
MTDLRNKTIRGGLAKIGSQGAAVILRMGSLMVLARLLDPMDFGLVGMVTAVMGLFNLLKDFGLSTAAVQRSTVSDGEMSALFWINVVLGAVLFLLSLAAAPLIAAFYHEPRLSAVTAVLAAGFIFNAVGVQHSVLLQRQMRFTALAAIDVVSLSASVGVGILMARSGFGYWALVAMAVSNPLFATACLWTCTAWLPERPRRQPGIRSMMRFGGLITLNGLVVYIAYNLEKVLLGRFWGAATVGIYGRAFQLITMPTDNLNSAVGGVAFSALSRLQDDPDRLKSYFLKGYSLVVAITIPVTMGCALFASDLIVVSLGPKWMEAAAILRLLTPTILVLAMINPLGWLLFALGLVDRGVRIALVLAPLVIAGYAIGLPYGPKGVAFGYSAMMVLWVIPHILWCVRGTVISPKDVLAAVSRPFLAIVPASALAGAVHVYFGNSLPPLTRLAFGSTVLFGTYLSTLVYVMRQKAFYGNLLCTFMAGRSSVEEKTSPVLPAAEIQPRLG